jgi:UDP-N-acetylmuramoyl-tripeptide--D-alanyl-D-alanine ligase
LAGRGARHRIAIGGGTALLIDESYNANPASMAATLAELGKFAGRKIAVLGAMKELGDRSDEFHLGLATPIAAAGVDHVIVVGEGMQILGRRLNAGVERPTQFAHCATAGEALDLVRDIVRESDTVLVKGSNSIGLSAIVSALTRWEA